MTTDDIIEADDANRERIHAIRQQEQKAKGQESTDDLFPELSGHTFKSLFERDVARQLVERGRAGEINRLSFGVLVMLSAAAIEFRIAFSYYEGDVQYYQDATRHENESYKIKKYLWLHYGPGPLRITKGRTGQVPEIVETVIPVTWSKQKAKGGDNE